MPPIFEALAIGPGDNLLLFLPMSNFQQRNMCYAALWYDFDLIITDYTQLFAAMPALNPTVLIAPPVLYQMLHAEYEKYPGWKKSLWSVLGLGLSLLPSASLRQGLARILFGDFYKQFGSRIRLLATGMAPIRSTIGKFFQELQLPLCESYGMVEAGSLTFRPPIQKSLARWANCSRASMCPSRRTARSSSAAKCRSPCATSSAPRVRMSASS